MKQNERILVYLVTGFLAIILVVAVFFGREGSAATKPNSTETVRGLGQILEQKPVTAPGGDAGAAGAAAEQPKVDPGAGGKVGEDPAAAKVSQPPLVATLPVAPAQRIAELFGESRRDRNVRIVRARPGDSLDSLVRRWCGKRDPFLAEATSLNEDLTILRPDQPVVVPWVDDEDVLAAFDARQPRLLANAGALPAPGVQPATTGPTFRSPGVAADPNPPNAGVPAGTRTYVVQPNDSLWKIAARHFGNSRADAMIEEIKRLNPGIKGDLVHPNQKLILPAGS